MRIKLIIHERLGKWAGQIRPRLSDGLVRIRETRSIAELESSLAPCVCPIAVIHVGSRIRPALEAIASARVAASQALILVVDAPDSPAFRLVAMELGATHVLAHPVLPPQILAWLERWIPLARTRTEAAGWSEDRRTEPDPWEAFLSPDNRMDIETLAVI